MEKLLVVDDSRTFVELVAHMLSLAVTQYAPQRAAATNHQTKCHSRRCRSADAVLGQPVREHRIAGERVHVGTVRDDEGMSRSGRAERASGVPEIPDA